MKCVKHIMSISLDKGKLGFDFVLTLTQKKRTRKTHQNSELFWGLGTFWLRYLETQNFLGANRFLDSQFISWCYHSLCKRWRSHSKSSNSFSWSQSIVSTYFEERRAGLWPSQFRWTSHSFARRKFKSVASIFGLNYQM